MALPYFEVTQSTWIRAGALSATLLHSHPRLNQVWELVLALLYLPSPRLTKAGKIRSQGQTPLRGAIPLQTSCFLAPLAATSITALLSPAT
jgi:hypothetical protein